MPRPRPRSDIERHRLYLSDYCKFINGIIKYEIGESNDDADHMMHTQYLKRYKHDIKMKNTPSVRIVIESKNSVHKFYIIIPEYFIPASSFNMFYHIRTNFVSNIKYRITSIMAYNIAEQDILLSFRDATYNYWYL